jgi:2-dehydropantoate 2-reductase
VEGFAVKVLMLGAGGVGGYFGGRMIQSGADVTFLVRDGRARQLAEHGLVIKSVLGDATMKVRTLTAASAGEPFDLILLSCKSYDLDTAIEAIVPHVAAGKGLVIPLLNGMAHADVLRARFGADRVLGGLCGIFATLSPAGEVVQMEGLAPRIASADSRIRSNAACWRRRPMPRSACSPPLPSTPAASSRSSRACGRNGWCWRRWPAAPA